MTQADLRTAGNGRLHTSTLGSESDYTRIRSVLINSAQLARKHFKYVGFCDSRMTSNETRRDLAVRTNRHESFIGMDASSLKRGGERKEGIEAMLPKEKTRDLARSLVASEAEANTTSLQVEPASVRVYERLRMQLSAQVGVDGFRALASRALALAKLQSPRLSEVQVTANGVLRGLEGVESQMDAGEEGEGGIILIAQLLGLFLTFLGEATTLRLMEDLRLQVDVRTEGATDPDDATASALDGPVMAAAFEDLLREIDRLRSVSDRIEMLANKHPGVAEGLVIVAGNIRSIATILDVFTLIRSKAGGPQDETPDLQKNVYMN
jgi:hypothetical protein